MKHKLVVAVCFALIVATLTGCQLAKQNQGSILEDRLVGFFITTESLSSFFSNTTSSYNYSEVIMGRITPPYQDRIYATMVSKIFEENGRIMETSEYVFEGVEGLSFFSPIVPATAESFSYITLMADDAVSDRHQTVKTSGADLIGTLYVSPSLDKLHFNPVFQSADGSVYAIRGEYGVLLQAYSEGVFMYQSLDTTTTETGYGKTITDSTSVKLSVSLMFTPEKITILQMDANNQLIELKEYAPGTLPQEFISAPNTSYVVVETYKRDHLGNLIISRDIYSRSTTETKTLIGTFSVREDGFCIKHYSQLTWQTK